MTDIVHPKKDMLLFAIGNLMGLQEFVNLGLLEQGIKEIMKEARVTFAYNLPLPSRTPPVFSPEFLAPRGCDENLQNSNEYPVDPRVNHNAVLPNELFVTKPLKWRADQIIYTDGSIRDTGGPEYCRSGHSMQQACIAQHPTLALQSSSVLIQLGTSMEWALQYLYLQRAEMVGLQHALSIDHSHHTRIIGTDSLCTMYMLSKHLRCPSLDRESKHLGILDAAVESIAKSLR